MKEGPKEMKEGTKEGRPGDRMHLALWMCRHNVLSGGRKEGRKEGMKEGHDGRREGEIRRNERK
jgi:hypothetical protein